jgi:hypothetical protein
MNYANIRNKRDTKVIARTERHAHLYVVLSEEEQEIKRKCEESLYFFIQTFWSTVEGEHEYFDNWHIRDISRHLQATIEGKIRYLVINIPFRCMKSLMCNVFFPAWVWIRNPHKKIFCLTGDKDLSLRDSVKCKRVLQSALFQRLWGSNFKFNSDVNTNSRYSNNKGGERIIKSIGGNAVGHGGDINIFDDINRADDIIYKTLRDRTRARLYSIFVRQDSTTSSVTIMIMQRLHEEDAAQLLLDMKLPGTVHLMLPMEYDLSRACSTISLAENEPIWRDPRVEQNELLWPSRMPRGYINELKVMLGTEYNRSSQLQQLPTAEAGNIFRAEWFNIWNEDRVPSCDFILQSWDTAISTNIAACLSACTTWGIFRKLNGSYNIILLGLWTGQLEQPDLRKMIVNLARNYRAKDIYDTRAASGMASDMVLIEDAFNGKGLIQDLKSSGLPIFPFSPRFHGLQGHSHETSKIARARLASTLVEQGLVWLPAVNGVLLSYAERVRKALLGCPTTKDQDIVDTISQAFIEIKRRELVYLPREEPVSEGIDWKNDPRLLEFMAPHMTMNNYSAL